MKPLLFNVITGVLNGILSAWVFNHVNPWAGLALFALFVYLSYHFNKLNFKQKQL